jgi:uncharacterized protein (DUF1800 family)
MQISESPQTAWETIAPSAWDDAAIRHLLRRAGWTARPADIQRAQAEGLEATLDRLFPVTPVIVPKSPTILRLEGDLPELLKKSREAQGPEKRSAQREIRERSQEALQDLRLGWLQMAALPANAASAKWILFLSDVYVVSADKVRNPSFIWQHFNALAMHGLERAPSLTKAISRSPAMATYLDLRQSKKDAPNENFARELFELFVLGEGHYTEQDIKEAARAFTGYRIQPLTGEVRFVPKQHDRSTKKIFGRSGPFSGDDVIDLAYAQPAAADFLPGELARFYLSDDPLPTDYRKALGARWRETEFNLRSLAKLFFGSRLFYAPEFRGNLIKSPLQFYLGLVQDLNLSVPPLPRHTLNPLRQMGQQLFQPPNVRGWLGGRTWINSSTLAARRQLVQQLFSPLREEALNADEQRALAEARAQGGVNFTVSDTWLETHFGDDSPDTSSQLTQAFLPGEISPQLKSTLNTFLSNAADEPQRLQRIRSSATALLQTPAYQLC